MALYPCRECGREVSDEAPVCPGCGVPEPVPALAAPQEEVGEVEEAAPAAQSRGLRHPAALVVLGVLAFWTIGVLFGGGEDAGGSGYGEHVGLSEYGASWPLTVASGYLKCVRGSAVVLEANGVEYGVNGTALALGYDRLDPIWRDDPTGVGRSVDVSPLIQRGLALC